MTKYRLFALILVVLCFVAGCCSHPVEYAALRDLETKQERYFERYIRRVDADPTMSAAEKDDEKKTVEAIKRQTTSVRKSIGGEE